MFHRRSERSRHHQLIIMIFSPKFLFGEILVLFPVDQHLSNRPRQINPSCTGQCFRPLQNEYRCCRTDLLRKHAEDILFLQFLHYAFPDALEFLIDEDGRLPFCQALFRDIHAVPGQAKQFPDPQRARKSEIDGQFQALVLTYLKGMEQGVRIPDVPGLFLCCRNCRQLCRILLDQFPLHRLCKSTVQKFMYSPHCPRSDKAVPPARRVPLLELFVRAADHCLCLKQCHIVFFKDPRRYV